MDLSQTIIPKSDQLNADDLISGPRVVRITEVKAGNAEQPVCISFDGDNGRPYKPGKSMRRVLVALWGKDSKAYIDKRIKIFTDPIVKFGGSNVGGIRISHASGLTEPLEMAMTETRGKRKPYTVHPLPEYATHLESLKTAAEAGGEALKNAFLALPKDIQEILRNDANALKPKA